MTWDFVLVNGPYGGTTEGPAWDGSGLLFTHIPASMVYRYDPGSRASTVFRSETNWANGLTLDAEGRLYACEGGARRVVRYEADGGTTVLVDSFEGERLNVPNDLAVDPDGRLWFTDPYYEGSGGAWSEDRANKDLDPRFGLPPRPRARGRMDGHPGNLRYDPAQRAALPRWTTGPSTWPRAGAGRKRSVSFVPTRSGAAAASETIPCSTTSASIAGLTGCASTRKGNDRRYSRELQRRAGTDGLRLLAVRRGTGGASGPGGLPDELHLRRTRLDDPLLDHRWRLGCPRPKRSVRAGCCFPPESRLHNRHASQSRSQRPPSHYWERGRLARIRPRP